MTPGPAIKNRLELCFDKVTVESKGDPFSQQTSSPKNESDGRKPK